jgi:hypothetical protein
MRTAVLCAIVAMVVPSHARAQSIPLTEADALARLSPDSPRLRAIRSAVMWREPTFWLPADGRTRG